MKEITVQELVNLQKDSYILIDIRDAHVILRIRARLVMKTGQHLPKDWKQKN